MDAFLIAFFVVVAIVTGIGSGLLFSREQPIVASLLAAVAIVSVILAVLKIIELHEDDDEEYQ